MKMNTDKKLIEEILTRSIDVIYPKTEAFRQMLLSGKQLRIYMGIDPTSTYAHLGHATNYIILQRLHRLGHKIIALIGDFTAMIGDPSDKTATRRRLSNEEVRENVKHFKSQIGKILDFDDKNNPIEFQFNSKWLSPMTFEKAVDLAAHFTVQQMLERDIFKKRLKEKKPLYVHEFFYPLMQGYDSVALNADVEIGGTDQTFNMLAGRELVRSYQNREKVVVVTTLLENPVTGEKLMSKSKGTGIGLNETPENMYGKTMALPDEVIVQCFTDCTRLSLEDMKRISRELKNGGNPRDFKARLAREIVTMYHGEAAAQKAEEQFNKVFRDKKNPDYMVPLTLPREDEVDLSIILVKYGLVSSKTEFRRLLVQRAIKYDGKIMQTEKVRARKNGILKIGKRRFARFEIHN